MLSGGDSLQAVRLLDHITLTMKAPSTGLLELILDGTFSDVLKHITTTQHNPNQTSTKRHLGDSTLTKSAKRFHTEVTSNHLLVLSERGRMGFVVVRRAGEVIDWNYSQRNTKEDEPIQSWIEETSTSSLSKQNRTDTSVRPTNTSQDPPSDQEKNEDPGNDVAFRPGITSEALPLVLRVCWSSDTGRCVDASPVLLVHSGRATVFIGSHSHRIQALDLSGGDVLWERVLGDRLESSAAVSRCGNLLAIG